MLTNILEKILIRMCHGEDEADFSEKSVVSRENNPLDLLVGEFPNFLDFARGKRVLDFGCGEGRQAVALASSVDCRVVGIDINDAILETARNLAQKAGIKSEDLRFSNGLKDDIGGGFDIVISQNSMEHFPDPDETIEVMKGKVSRTGCIFITFGPPWYAPYGSHMHYFCKIPWLNIIFPESVVMKVRSRYRKDGALRYEDVESGLNRMSLARFSSLLKARELHLIYSKITCAKGLNFLGRIPFVREMFVNRVSVVVSPTPGQTLKGPFRTYTGR